MKTICVRKDRHYLHHGIKNDFGGFSGTMDNGWSYKLGILAEYKKLNIGEEFKIEKNGIEIKNGAIFRKIGFNDLELLNY